MAIFKGTKLPYCSSQKFCKRRHFQKLHVYEGFLKSCFHVQNRKNEAAEVLTKIFDLTRLEDEVDFLTAQSEQERQRRSDIKFWHVFKSKEIRLAFLVGGGLLVIKC